MIQHPSAAPRGAAGGSVARRPELPRTLLDTRMPPAPAAGGRVIAVEPAAPVTVKRTSAPLLLSALLVGAALAIGWRRLRRRRDPRHPA